MQRSNSAKLMTHLVKNANTDRQMHAAETAISSRGVSDSDFFKFLCIITSKPLTLLVQIATMVGGLSSATTEN